MIPEREDTGVESHQLMKMAASVRSASRILGALLVLAGGLAARPVLAQAPAVQRPAAAPSPAPLPAPRVAPQAGYQFHDESIVGGFVVQRWVSAAAPEVSPAGMCECITLVYQGDRRIVTLGAPDDITAVSVVAPTGRDINRDGTPELIVSTWSGGAHCCYTTAVYSVGAALQPILSLNTGNCGGAFADLNADGTLEFSTCDDTWAYAYCAFAYSPSPRVVFAYDRSRREYRVATPRFGRTFRDQIASDLAEARTHLAASTGQEPDLDKCAVLKPALGLMYSGRITEGQNLIRRLYPGRDGAAFLQEVTAKVRASPLWTER